MEENAKQALATLPPELVGMILLHEVMLEDGVTPIVCRLVCKQWRDLIPARVIHLPQNKLRLDRVMFSSTLSERKRSAVASTVARRGSLSLLKWLVQQGCPFNQFMFVAASRAMVEWLYEMPMEFRCLC